MNKTNPQYFKDRRNSFIEAGLCECGQEKALPGLKVGKRCRRKRREAKALQRANAAERGKCTQCLKRKAREGKKSCATCSKRWKEK